MKHALAALLLAVAGTTAVVADGITSPWERIPSKPDKSQGAVVSQVVSSNTWVQIAYHRPSIRERDVWTAKNSRGQPIVPGADDSTPWRVGANECTTFEVSTDVLVESLELPAGKYGLFMIPGDDSWTVIFNEDHEQWGSRGYDESKDVLRINVAPEKVQHNEFLQFGFDFAETTWTRAYMHWGRIKVPFEVSLLPKRG